jgi:flagellar basal body-associated protein FliL
MMKKIKNKIIFILIIILLIFLLLSYLFNINNNFKIIAKNQQFQQQKIEQLEVSNARLENIVVNQHQQIKELQARPSTVKTVTQQKTVYIDENKKVEADESKQMDTLGSPETFLTTTIATLLVGGRAIVSLLPAIP